MAHTNESLRAAVWEYFRDKAACERRHGKMSTWDVSRVTDMSRLFYDRRDWSGDPGIGAWDTSSVTSMSSVELGSSRASRRRASGADSPRRHAIVSSWPRTCVNGGTRIVCVSCAACRSASSSDVTDADGIITVPLADLGAGQQIHVMVIDGHQAVYDSTVRAEQLLKPQSSRMRHLAHLLGRVLPTTVVQHPPWAFQQSTLRRRYRFVS